MSRPSRAPPARIVLLRPRNPENLGAVARAMKNFGLSDWAIAELGTHADLLARDGIYARLYRIQYAAERAAA